MSVEASTPVISEIGREYLRLHLACDVGPVRLRKLIDYFGTPQAVLGASEAELQQVDKVGEQVARSIRSARRDRSVDREIQNAADLGVRILCWDDLNYPRPLLHIPDPPICLYVRGALQPTDTVALAVVGTRRCSHYGMEQAKRFSESFARAGFTVVSGLARGIDGCAHQGALRAGGRTIAVLGNGLGHVYPSEHEELAEQVVESGALVSELPIDIAPEPGNFPRRNRIIIGLSLGVIVVEAGHRSGALISARLANEYNREAFALPGRIDQPQLTAGVHKLIRDGEAKLVTCLEDVLDELKEVGDVMRQESAVNQVSATHDGVAGQDEPAVMRPPSVTEPSSALRLATLSDQERAVFGVLKDGFEEIDAVQQKTRLTMAGVTSVLISLQLKGFIRQLPGNRFVPRD